MQLEPGCLKEINIDKAGSSQSAVDAVIALRLPSSWEKDPQWSRQKVHNASPSNHGQGENASM